MFEPEHDTGLLAFIGGGLSSEVKCKLGPIADIPDYLLVQILVYLREDVHVDLISLFVAKGADGQSSVGERMAGNVEPGYTSSGLRYCTALTPAPNLRVVKLGIYLTLGRGRRRSCEFAGHVLSSLLFCLTDYFVLSISVGVVPLALQLHHTVSYRKYAHMRTDDFGGHKELGNLLVDLSFRSASCA